MANKEQQPIRRIAEKKSIKQQIVDLLKSDPSLPSDYTLVLNIRNRGLASSELKIANPF